MSAGWRVFAAFCVSGAIAVVVAVLRAARYGTIDSTGGTGYDRQAGAAPQRAGSQSGGTGGYMAVRS